MPLWAVLTLATIAIVPTTIASIATLIYAVRTNRSMNGLLNARVLAAKAEGKVDEQHDQAVRDNA
jgi:hypothetical protein